MRTTLAIDDDVLAFAKALADRDRRPVGAVVSELARRGMKRQSAPRKTRNGIPLLQRSEPPPAPITLELVNSLRDDEE